jgi:hypothetical protein
MDDDSKDSIALNPSKNEGQVTEQSQVVSSKKALRAFHAKCLDYAKERNVSYLDPSDLTLLLGGPDNVKPSFVVEVMNTMLSYVSISTRL